MFWNNVVQDVAHFAQAAATSPSSSSSSSSSSPFPPHFYHVAIDCPGYGRSPGDKQSVRSQPGALLSQVVQALGRRTAAAICGSSQGSCALFNAALENAHVAQTLAVCHPVGHAPHRYANIRQPTLLIFDTEDAGHPVSVGRKMRKHLPNNRWVAWGEG